MDWNVVKEFLVTYWREIVTGIGAIVSLCIAIFRKRPKSVVNAIDACLVYLDEILPGLINDAELLPGLKGKDKLALVIESSKRELVKKFGYCLDSPLIANRIESYLSTPEASIHKEVK